jgi:hypothetical protein
LNHLKDENFYYVNFEDERLRTFKAQDFNDIYEAQLSLFGKKNVFLLDEVQNIHGFESFVRRFKEMGFKFYLTGSNANLLSKELGTKLTGRYLMIELTPFSFREFLDFKEIDHDERAVLNTETRVEIIKGFDEYLREGGMPEYLKYRDLEILFRTYEDIVIKDIVVRYGLENVRLLKDLYTYLISNVTNRFSYNSLKKIIGAGSSTTVQNYIHYLEEAYFCKVVHRYDTSIKVQLSNPKKFYLADHGFIRPISSRTTKDLGKILENIIFYQLSRKGEVFYHENGRECDLVLVERNEITSMVQVTWELNESNMEREIEGLTEAMKKYGLDNGIIVTKEQEDELEMEGGRIEIIPAWKWCLYH